MKCLSDAFSLFLNEKKKKAIELLENEKNPKCEFALGVLSLLYGVNPLESIALINKHFDYIFDHKDEEDCYVLLTAYFHVYEEIGTVWFNSAHKYLLKHNFEDVNNKLFLANILLDNLVNKPKSNRKKIDIYVNLLKEGLKKENLTLAKYYYDIDEKEKSDDLLKTIKGFDAKIESAIHVALTDYEKGCLMVEKIKEERNYFCDFFLSKAYLRCDEKEEKIVKNLLDGLHLGHPIFARYIFNLCKYNLEFIKKYDIETILKSHAQYSSDNYYYLAKISESKKQETSYLRYLKEGNKSGSFLAKKELFNYYLKKQDLINALKLANEEKKHYPSLLALFYLNQIEVDYKKVLSFLESGLEINDINSYFVLGKMYLYGNGVEKNEKKAEEYLTLVGSDEALEELTKYYFEDKTKSFKFCGMIDSAKENFDSEALLTFAKFSFDGLIEASLEKAETLFKLASCSGNKEAYLFLALINEDKGENVKAKKYYEASLPLKEAYFHYATFLTEVNPNAKKIKKAIELLETGGQLGDKSAYNSLSYIYYKGKNVKRDLQKSYDYLQKCIDLPVAKHNLAYFYLYGDVVEKDVSKALELLNEAAEAGYLPSYTTLGDIYLDSQFVEKDFDKARKYFLQAAEKGLTSAYLTFGEYLLTNDYDTKKHFKEIEEDFKKALKNEEDRALLLLGKLHATKYNNPKHFEQALSYYEQAMKKYSGEAHEGIGELYFLKKDYKKSQKYYEHALCIDCTHCVVPLAKSYLFDKENQDKGIALLEAAGKDGSGEAFFILGKLYIDGKKVKCDKEKGISYMEEAAKNDFPAAFYYLGEMYLDGTLVKQDYIKARKYFEKGATFDNAPCINCLGVMCSNANGFTKEESKNYISYFEIAAKLDFLVGKYNYAVSLVNESKSKQNVEKAIDILLEVAQCGLKQAYLELANIYISDEFEKQDVEKALHYYDLAIKAGVSDASYQLGSLYLRGEELPRDFKKAMDYFKIASKKKHPMALFSLGCMYYYGTSGVNDYSLAKKCFEDGAELNMPDCYYYLGVMYRDGIGVRKNRIIADTYFIKAEELGKEVIDERDYKYAA